MFFYGTPDMLHVIYAEVLYTDSLYTDSMCAKSYTDTCMHVHARSNAVD